ncbi:MAG: ligase-associated damage response endonuclease PdeM [Pseudomonadota bacterium]
MVATIDFAGTRFLVAGDAALFWPEQHALLVADLHLEKASSYALAGQMLPPYDSRATMEELATQIEKTSARAVWCLGDNFHDDGGEARLESEAAGLLRSITEHLDWRWIVGNHDPGLAAHWGGQVMEEMTVDGILLRHEAEPQDRRPEISGHFHPKLRQVLRGRMVSRRCFVRSETKMIMPAFGALTGGLHAEAHAILQACDGKRLEALVPAAGRVLSFALDSALAE